MQLLTVRGLCKKYSDRTVLDSIDFHITANEIVGFLGRNGQGKSTTIRIIAGFSRPDSGSITFPSRKNLKTGFLHESPVFWEELTVKEFLTSLCFFHNTSSSELIQLTELTGLRSHFNQTIQTLSRGLKQRVGITASLIGNPELLILDEPMTALDPAGRIRIKNLLLNLKKERGISIFFSSHHLHEVAEISDRILILNQGKITADRKISEIDNIESFFTMHSGEET